MKSLLFLCTGNYYRSRFCEAYFNHQALHQALAWRADSRGLAPDMTAFGNIGPLSPHTRQALNALGVNLAAPPRDPCPVYPDDFNRSDRVIALSRAEHQPMVERFFPAYQATIEYWEIGDLPIAAPAAAIPMMIAAVDQLIETLRVA